MSSSWKLIRWGHDRMLIQVGKQAERAEIDWIHRWWNEQLPVKKVHSNKAWAHFDRESSHIFSNKQLFTAALAQELWAPNMSARTCVTLPDCLFHVVYSCHRSSHTLNIQKIQMFNNTENYPILWTVPAAYLTGTWTYKKYKEVDDLFCLLNDWLLNHILKAPYLSFL